LTTTPTAGQAASASTRTVLKRNVSSWPWMETKTSSTRDYVNLISLQGSTNGPRLVRRDLFFPLRRFAGAMDRRQRRRAINSLVQ